MRKMKRLKWLIGLASAGAAAEAGLAEYFFRRTMIRQNASTERTQKMAGTCWEQYLPMIRERRERMMSQEHEDVWITSGDGLRLHGTYFPGDGGNKIVICFHGYTGAGTKDYAGLSAYYLKRGWNMLLVDERAHGESEGKYIGFGCLDRFDAQKWIEYTIEKMGEDCDIFLHGISMGGATVLMTSGLDLPPQVRGIISDCAFTSAKDVFAHVLRDMYHIPAFPLLQLADIMNRKRAGYGLDECNAALEVQKAQVPILFIHGTEDTFVPTRMCTILCENCASDYTCLFVEGASHAESYYKETERYEKALDTFTEDLLKGKKKP